jgi:hypothetical protein
VFGDLIGVRFAIRVREVSPFAKLVQSRTEVAITEIAKHGFGVKVGHDGEHLRSRNCAVRMPKNCVLDYWLSGGMLRPCGS